MAHLALRQTHSVPFRLTTLSLREGYHHRSQYFTTEVTSSDIALGQRLASHPEQKAAVSSVYWTLDWTLMCLFLYSQKVVMYGGARVAEQKQEEEEMYIPWELFDTITRRFCNNETIGCDTTQSSGCLIRGLLLIPVRLCPHVPWGRNTEEVIDSSHHNLWEGQNLAFSLLGDEGYYSIISKGPTQELFREPDPL